MRMKIVRIAFASLLAGSTALSCGGRSAFDASPSAGGSGGAGKDDASVGSGGTGTGGKSSGGTGGRTGAGTGGRVGGGTGGRVGGTGGKAGGTGGRRGAGGAGTGGTAGIPDGGDDSGAGDSGSDGGDVDRCATARFCDSFESYATGGPPRGSWQLETTLGAVSVVSEQKVSGTRSVKFTTPQNAAFKNAFIRLSHAALFPAPGNAYFGRMMFRVESVPRASAHWTIIQSSGVVPGQTYHAVYRYGGQQPITEGTTFIGSQLMANYDTPDFYSGSGPGSDCWLHADKKVVPVGRWACAEWQFDGAHNTMRFWLDGVPLEALTMPGTGKGCVHQPATYTWTAPAFQDVAVGWQSYMTDDARTMYIDDVVIDTAKIGCPRVP